MQRPHSGDTDSLRKFEPPEQNNFNTKTMPALYLLYESAHGYALLEAYGLDTIGASLDGVQKSVTELDRFGKVRDPFFSVCGACKPSCALRPAAGTGGGILVPGAPKSGQVLSPRSRLAVWGDLGPGPAHLCPGVGRAER